MTPLVDHIGNLITAMKPTQTFTLTGSASPYTLSGLQHPELLFVGMKVKMTGVNFTASGVHTIATISGATITVTGEAIVPPTPPATMTGSFVPLINYIYGHREEIKNTLIEWTQKPTVNKEQFPLIMLFLDIPENFSEDGFVRDAELNMAFVTDSKQEYKAADRYTYTLKVIIYPLIDLFFYSFRRCNSLTSELSTYKRTDRLLWGTGDAYGMKNNMFADFLDGVEIENLKVKIFEPS
jgi:hypothetical protein